MASLSHGRRTSSHTRFCFFTVKNNYSKGLLTMYGLRSIFLFGFYRLACCRLMSKDAFAYCLAPSQGGYFRLEVSSINPVDWWIAQWLERDQTHWLRGNVVLLHFLQISKIYVVQRYSPLHNGGEFSEGRSFEEALWGLRVTVDKSAVSSYITALR